MAFQSSVSATQETIDNVCLIEIVDGSNYDVDNDPPDPEHTRNRFNKKRVIITNQDGIEFIMDSIDNPPVSDETIDPPAFGVSADTNQYAFLGNDGNGTYGIELFTVPDYIENTAYSVDFDHIVYLDGLFYRTTINSNTSDPTLLVGWVVVDYTYLRTTSKYYSSTTVEIDCLTSEAFQESLYDSAASTFSVVVNETCDAITITDESNYAENTDGGHNIMDFTLYRTIIITRPKSGDYVMSSVASLNPDEAISAPSSGNNVFTYNLTSDDEDGLFTISLCAFPTWRDTASYTTNARQTIVYYNGVLYKLLQANTNQQPDISPDYWEVFVVDGEDEYVTRYCYIAKIAVKCISLTKCRERLTHEAFCLMNSDFCNDDVLCKNKKFLDLQKLRTLDDAMVYSMNRNQWNEVEAQFNLMRKICNC